MKSIEIKYKPHDKPSNKSRHIASTPIIQDTHLKACSMLVVKSFLAGTESNEWLLLAEKKAYEFIKNGN